MTSPKRNIPRPLRPFRDHGPVLIGVLILVFAVYGRLCTGAIWNPVDYQILHDAHKLAVNPWAMFQHIGAWFSQPLLQLFFLVEYRTFGLDFGMYIAVNLLLHALNAFVVYMLVNMLFHRVWLARLAAVLFALGVGSFGRNLLSIAGQESLLLATLHLAVLYLFIRNDFRREGQLWSPYFVLGIVLYGLSGLTKASTLSVLGCLVAYKAFFYQRRERRPVFSNDLLIFLFLGLLFQLGQSKYGFRTPTVVSDAEGPLVYTWLSVVNLFRYLNLMVFPLQESTLLREAGVVVQLLFQVRVVINTLLTVYVISFSFFGFVFGSRPLRFFIAWTYITLIPFTAQAPGVEWLNLTHLYLASLGFCVVLSAGAIGAVNLLEIHRWRRLVPLLVPLLFAVTAISLTYRLDARNRETARTPALQEIREETLDRMRERPVRLVPTR
ncbi:hypothetical protein GF314_04085 [bacterium]|nr:hypothetical protein [bacterium]